MDFLIHDGGNGERLKATVADNGNGTLLITVEGYGSHEKHAGIIELDCNDNGELMLHVRSDIHHEVPTHRINLEGARESKRGYFPWGAVRPRKEG